MGIVTVTRELLYEHVQECKLIIYAVLVFSSLRLNEVRIIENLMQKCNSEGMNRTEINVIAHSCL